MSVQKIIDKALTDMKADIIRRHEAAGQVASGKTKSMFKVEAQELSGQLSGAAWAGTLQVGRKGGKVPYEFQKIIMQWARAKGIRFKNNREAASFAWVVARRIQKDGTLRNKNHVDIFTTAEKVMIEKLTAELATFYKIQITNKIYDSK